jgi:ribose transport system permease protein
MNTPTPTTDGPVSGLGRSRFAGLRESRVGSALSGADTLGLLLVYVALFVYLSVATRYFLSGDNISNLLREMAVLGIVAVGQTLVILRAEIDLSVSAVVAVAAVVAAEASQAGWSTVPTIAAGLAVGCAFGLFNGLLVARTGISSLVVTLGTLTIGSGLALVLTGGAPEEIDVGFLTTLGQGSVGGVAYQFLVMLAVVVIAFLVLRYLVFGRSLYAVGDNARAARLNGIRVERMTVWVFVLSGLLASVGGLLLAGQFETADPTIGGDLNLRSIAAVVIGGTSLFGGVGGVAGTLLGTALIATLSNGLVQLNVPSAWQEVVTGAVIVAAVLFDRLRARRREP